MKKIIITICITVSLAVAIPSFSNNLNQINKTMIYSDSTPPERSREELYQDIFMSLLMPYIDKAVYDYYGQTFAVDPWSPKVLNIERPNGYRTFYFIINLEITPYYGPHRWVGVDQIAISVGGIGKVNIEKFEHIKTYYIPPKPTRP